MVGIWKRERFESYQCVLTSLGGRPAALKAHVSDNSLLEDVVEYYRRHSD